MDDGYTVLDDWSRGDEMSHREFAEELVPQLEEEMSEDEYAEFRTDVREVVLEEIMRDLSANLSLVDWFALGFDDAEDFLDAERVSEAIASEAKAAFKHDQVGKSNAILNVILEHAEEYDLISRK